MFIKNFLPIVISASADSTIVRSPLLYCQQKYRHASSSESLDSNPYSDNLLQHLHHSSSASSDSSSYPSVVYLYNYCQQNYRHASSSSSESSDSDPFCAKILQHQHQRRRDFS